MVRAQLAVLAAQTSRLGTASTRPAPGVFFGGGGAKLADHPSEADLLLHARLQAVLGARDADELAAYGQSSLAGEVLLLRPEELREEGVAAATRRAVEAVAAQRPWWPHVDLDVLATDQLAAVGYPRTAASPGSSWPVWSAPPCRGATAWAGRCASTTPTSTRTEPRRGRSSTSSTTSRNSAKSRGPGTREILAVQQPGRIRLGRSSAARRHAADGRASGLPRAPRSSDGGRLPDRPPDGQSPRRR